MTSRSPAEWIFASIIGLLGMIINAIILYIEMKKRISGSAIFTTKYLKLWSFLCILCGVIQGLFQFLLPFNGFCYFGEFVQNSSTLIQPAFMGFYQLSRLNYCFAQNKVYSNKGYPNWLFIIMYTMGIMGIIGIIIIYLLTDIRRSCGINKHSQHYYHQIKDHFGSLYDDSIMDWILPSIFVGYFVWDIGTLLLYILKIKSLQRFKSYDINIWNRILSILYRVLIPTLFYEITSLSLVLMTEGFFGYLYDIHFGYIQSLITSILFSYSMLIMLEHNNLEYMGFLRFLRDFKLNYICCCYKHIVIIQLNELEDDVKESQGVNKGDIKKKKSVETTLWETRGISVDVGKIETNESELSVI